MLNVRIAGVVFNGSAPDALDAFVIGPDGWAGWDDAPAVRRESLARPGQHGAFGFRGYRDARVVTISGAIVASSPAKLQQMRNRLMGMLADGGAGRLTVEQPLATTWANVMLADMPTVKVRGQSETEATFQIQFWSPLPQKYGEVRDFAEGAPAFQFGNFPATPKLLIGAGAGGYTVTGPSGRTIVVATAPAAAHEIDFANGGLYLAGVRQLGAITTYQPWSVPPGLPGVAASISGARSLTQRLPDTFI